VPHIFVLFQLNLNFLDMFSKKLPQYNISRKAVQWEPSCSMRMDGRDEAFCNFAEAHKNPLCVGWVPFLGAFAKLQKASSHPSIRMEQPGSHWTDFHEI
jgi:hypothetical protein